MANSQEIHFIFSINTDILKIKKTLLFDHKQIIRMIYVCGNDVCQNFLAKFFENANVSLILFELHFNIYCNEHVIFRLLHKITKRFIKRIKKIF